MPSAEPNSTLILPFADVLPAFAGPPVYTGKAAALLGRVTAGRDFWLGDLAVLRGDGERVQVGDDCHLGARATLHIVHERMPCIVGDRVSIGDNACVHACTVGDDVIIGDNVVVLDDAVVEDNVILEDDALVFPGKHIAGGYLYAGAPAKPLRALEPGEVAARHAHIRRGRDTMAAPRRIKAAMGEASKVDSSVFIATTARLRGMIRAAANASVFFSNELDAGDAFIAIGARTNVQDNTIIRCSTAQGVTIGHDSTVGHNVLIEDSVIGNHALIGIGSTVTVGTVVHDHVLLAAGARTAPGQVLESGWLYAGSPARKLAPLDTAKRDMIGVIVGHYCGYSQAFKRAQEALARSAG
jgi:carbonic anhydrase/acetyltransferase-like protein (isoleucine patch superfamily)